MINSKLKIFTLLLGLLWLQSCTDTIDNDDDGDGNWVRRSDYEGDTRSGAVSFTIDGFAYVGLGSDGDDYFKDFWRYDPERNFWQEVAEFPGEGRISAVAFSLEGKGYVGTGFNTDLQEEELRDFWEYNPTEDTWTRVSDFGGSARFSAVAFTLNNKGYVGTGYDGSFLKDFWTYDPTTDTWEQTVSLFGSKRENAIAFVINGIAYVGSGINNNQFLYDFWAFDPENESWEDLALNDDDDDYDEFISAMERDDAVSFIIDDVAYIGTGRGSSSFLANVIAFDPLTNRWQDGFTFFEGTSRAAAVGFTLNNKGYIVTGRSGSSRHDDIWEFRPADEFDEFD